MTVFAGGKNEFSVSKDGRTTYAAKASGYIGGAPLPALQAISNNISTYPLARYFCCYGNTISAAGSVIGAQYADAVPFTPSANAHITKIIVGVGYVTGTNSVAISINSDNNGIPGNPIVSFDATGLGAFGSCCELSIESGSLAITKGTPYWLVVSTDQNSSDTWDAWNYNTTDMTSHPFAFQNNGLWTPTSGLLPDYGIFGTP